LQDEVAILRDRLSLSLGTKIEANPFTGAEVQPSFRLLWRPTQRQTLWSAVSRAIRSPSPFEAAVQLNLAAYPIGPETVALLQLVGNGKMRSEELLAYEVGYRVRPHNRVGIDVASFFNRYHRLSACELGTPVLSGGILTTPYLLGNNLDGRSYGIEVAATYNVVSRWTLRGTYSWLHARTLGNRSHPGAQPLLDLEAGPQHWFNVRSSLSLPHEVNLATSVFYNGAEVSGALKHYTRLDTQVSWAPARGWELSVIGQNLLRPSHQEFVAWDQGVPELVRRSIFARIVHRF
jgi:iron complex outermembrane receptor protein